MKRLLLLATVLLFGAGSVFAQSTSSDMNVSDPAYDQSMQDSDLDMDIEDEERMEEQDSRQDMRIEDNRADNISGASSPAFGGKFNEEYR